MMSYTHIMRYVMTTCSDIMCNRLLYMYLYKIIIYHDSLPTNRYILCPLGAIHGMDSNTQRRYQRSQFGPG